MTPSNDSTGIVALDELGHRLEAAIARRPRRRFLPRGGRWPAVALGLLALAATPALAAVLDGPESVVDQLPRVAAAVDYDDPAATGRALAREGFRVRWVLVSDNPARDADSPTVARDVPAPPAGTEILAVLDRRGGYDVDARTRELQIEVAPVGSRILETHR